MLDFPGKDCIDEDNIGPPQDEISKILERLNPFDEYIVTGKMD